VSGGFRDDTLPTLAVSVRSPRPAQQEEQACGSCDGVQEDASGVSIVHRGGRSDCDAYAGHGRKMPDSGTIVLHIVEGAMGVAAFFRWAFSHGDGSEII